MQCEKTSALKVFEISNTFLFKDVLPFFAKRFVRLDMSANSFSLKGKNREWELFQTYVMVWNQIVIVKLLHFPAHHK